MLHIHEQEPHEHRSGPCAGQEAMLANPQCTSTDHRRRNPVQAPLQLVVCCCCTPLILRCYPEETGGGVSAMTALLRRTATSPSTSALTGPAAGASAVSSPIAPVATAPVDTPPATDTRSMASSAPGRGRGRRVVDSRRCDATSSVQLSRVRAGMDRNALRSCGRSKLPCTPCNLKQSNRLL